MLYFPNTLPSFAKMLIGFHDIYRRMWKNIYPCNSIEQILKLSPTHENSDEEIDTTCPTCEKVFKSKYILNDHIRVRHKGEPFREVVENENDLKCPACDLKLKSRNYLKEHIRVKHKGEARRIMRE